MVNKKVILVVDDEPDLREIIKDQFEIENAIVYEAENGKRALELIKEIRFDAVLSDVRMPGGDGISLVKAMGESMQEPPPLILITGYGDIKPDEAYDLGVDGFYFKPFELEEIRLAVDKLFASLENRWSEKLEPSPSAAANAAPSSSGNELNEGAFKRLEVDLEVQEAIDLKKINLGRGGFFVKDVQKSFILGEIIEFKIGTQLQGQGIVQWIRNNSLMTLPLGIGVEFQYLEPYSREFFKEWLKGKTMRAFIPRST